MWGVVVKDNTLYMKIIYKVKQNNPYYSSREKNLNYFSNEDMNKYIICGGMYNKDGGSLVFRLKDIEEAKELVRNTKYSDSNNKFTLEYKLFAF